MQRASKLEGVRITSTWRNFPWSSSLPAGAALGLLMMTIVRIRFCGSIRAEGSGLLSSVGRGVAITTSLEALCFGERTTFRFPPANEDLRGSVAIGARITFCAQDGKVEGTADAAVMVVNPGAAIAMEAYPTPSFARYRISVDRTLTTPQLISFDRCIGRFPYQATLRMWPCP